jgi:hypothetical protein
MRFGLKLRALQSITIACLAVANVATAQTVRPLINELGNPAKGRVEYVNDASVPLNVTVEAKSFSVSEKGEISYRPLDGNIHLKLSSTSFRIPPQQTYFLFYEASSDTSPAWFVIYASFSGFGIRTQEGMNVRIQLPHTVYLLPKGDLGQPDVHIVSAEYDPAHKKVSVVTENSGANFGRVQQAFLSGGKKREEGSGFPLFPHSRREMNYEWEGDQPPDKLTLEFEKFKVESEVKRGP